MKATQEQYWEIVNYCLDRYSKNTIHTLANILNTHDAVIEVHKLIRAELPEEKFLEEISKLEA